MERNHFQPELASNHRLRAVIEHAAHLLPAQGPITVFIHHNTLHAFEEQTFDQAVRTGGEVFGCEPYLAEERYRAELSRGRIRFDDLRALIAEDLGERAEDSLVDLATRLELRLAMLRHPFWTGTAAELEWFIAETDALRRVRSDVSVATRGRFVSETRRWVMRDLRGSAAARPPARDWAIEAFTGPSLRDIESWSDDVWEAYSLQLLWRVCCDGVKAVPSTQVANKRLKRHRDLIVAAKGIDPDGPVHELLIRFCAAFLDQGISHWPLPDRNLGFYSAFISLYGEHSGFTEGWFRELRGELTRLKERRISAVDSIAESLELLGVAENELEEYISATLLALRGWGGMIRQMEQRGDSVAHPIPRSTLEEFLAVRLVLDRLAAGQAARKAGFNGPLARLREDLQCPPSPGPTVQERAFPVFQIAQVFGWSPGEMRRLKSEEWSLLVYEIEAFSNVERRRIFHLGYEQRFRKQVLDAVCLNPHRARQVVRQERPRFQIVACLDEREESFRRHIEEVAPDVETFGAAGFFNVAMYFKGSADAHFVPLCPIVLTPKHWVEERASEGHEHIHRRRAAARKRLGVASHRFHVGTRSAAAGAVLTVGLGALAAIPLVARILFPRIAAWFGRVFGHYVRTPPATRLKLERLDPEPGPENDHQGYTVEEMATVAARLLRDIGMTKQMARLVFVMGHGSDSLNNPHKSAYDCGACGGSPGAPNGRALAQMLNDPRVRERIAADGIVIPSDTWFVGGYHNTCDDSVTYADPDRVPDTHHAEFARARRDFEEACDRNAHERSRRFVSAPLDHTPVEARRHVYERSVDLAQARPELGHATNAICIVSRRERTRGLFFDRRAFLASYDPDQDDTIGTTLARILGAAVPVCGGINLEYYFSHVDSQGYGCGTKLPHNITSLLGVMDGAASDLRTGLPWQMVEIHEPVRLLFVVESTPEVLISIMDRNPTIGTMVRNGWVQLTCLDPSSSNVRLYQKGNFILYEPQATQLPKAATSADWYRGWRDHLEFAAIGDC